MTSHNRGRVSCAKCGFLIAVVPHGECKEDRDADPDRLRELDLPESASDEVFEGAYTISSWWSCRHTHPVHLTAYQLVNLTWDKVLLIRCARRIWKIEISIYSGWGKLEYNDKSREAAWRAVKEIRAKRRCSHFFEYMPGLSLAEHLLEQRETKRSEHERELAQKTRVINWIAIVVSIIALIISYVGPLMIIERIAIEGPVVVVEPTPSSAVTIELTETPVFTPTVTSGTQEAGG